MTNVNKNIYVYCTDCKYEKECNKWNRKDSKPYIERQIITAEYILNCFKGQKSKYNNSKVGIFTNDYHKALKFFTNLYHKERQNIDYYRNSKIIQEIKLLDNTQYLWIKPIDNSRGYKVEKAYIDENLTLNELHDIVLPICVYCREEDVKII